MLNPMEKLLIVSNLIILLFRIIIALSDSTKTPLRRNWAVILHTTSSFRFLIKWNEWLRALFADNLSIVIEIEITFSIVK